MRRLLPIFVLVACGPKASSTPVTPEPKEDPQPDEVVAADGCTMPDATWSDAEIAQPMVDNLGGGDDPVESHVLAWQSQQDAESVIDQAIVWIKLRDAYTLAHVYRNTANEAHVWNVIVDYESDEFLGSVDYEAPPTHAQLDDFLYATEWGFEADSGYDLVKSGICAAAWQTTFGEAPWHRYAE